jgi:hypothetical protein
MLPTRPLPTDTVEIAGETVTFRSLSRDEVFKLANFSDDPAGAEVFMLSRACSIPETEVQAWRETTDAVTVAKLLAAIAALSGVTANPGEPTPSSSDTSAP